jgi:exosortase/archaeosortase family protein
MKILQTLLSLKYRIYTISFLIIFIVYIFLHFFLFESDPVIAFLSFLSNSYLSLVEMSANKFLSWTGSEVRIENHILMLNGDALTGFIPQIRFKIWMIIFLFIVWITKTTIKKRILFSLLLIVLHYLIGSMIVVAGAYLSGFKNSSNLLTIPVTLGLLILFTILFFWYRKHKDLILNSLSKLKINTDRFNNDFHFFMITFVFILLYYFLFDFFEYELWIDLLFTTAQKILRLFGYNAAVEPFNLVGVNGTIFMLKSCLGYQTMLLFAAIVFLTGNTSSKIRWTYIISGLLLINFANILRFVFLFIHIEKHGKYKLAMNVHDMYNYIIYILVFILWVIWFEKFADSKRSRAHSELE